MNRKQINIAVFGSSVALTIRPKRLTREEGNYCDIIKSKLKDQGNEVYLMNYASRSRIISHENVLDYVGNLQKANPDYVILHYGINEAAPRLWPYRIWMLLHKPKWYRGRMFMYFNSKLVKIESLLMKIFKSKGWVTEKKFEKLYRALIETAVSETKSKIITISICEPNDHYIKVLPNIEKQISEYNAIIEKVSMELSAVFINLQNISSQIPKRHVAPDGAHLSGLGHQIVGEEILNIILRINDEI